MTSVVTPPGLAAIAPSPPWPEASLPLPIDVGLGLKMQHVPDVVSLARDADGQQQAIRPAFFEIHPENYMGAGGLAHAQLEAVRRDYPLSFHGVGLSLGSADGLDPEHLNRLAGLIDRYEPAVISEHLSWSAAGDWFFHDLLPLAYNRATLARFADHVNQAQDHLGRRLLIENPSTYLVPKGSTMSEPHFIAELCARTGCGWLLDLNNIHVCAINHGFDAADYLDAVDGSLVGEIHLAGHASETHPGGPLLIDDHGAAIADPVWALLDRFTRLHGARPTLIERDTNIPPLSGLLDEVAIAQRVLAGRKALHHAS